MTKKTKVAHFIIRTVDGETHKIPPHSSYPTLDSFAAFLQSRGYIRVNAVKGIPISAIISFEMRRAYVDTAPDAERDRVNGGAE